jgi:hypothetical protein
MNKLESEVIDIEGDRDLWIPDPQHSLLPREIVWIMINIIAATAFYLLIL